MKWAFFEHNGQWKDEQWTTTDERWKEGVEGAVKGLLPPQNPDEMGDF
jgi:hypothetical protein